MSTEVLVEAAAQEKIDVLKKDAAALMEKAQEIAQINEPAHEERATEFRAQIKRRLKVAEEARKFLVDPLNAHVKRINAQVKEATGPMEEADRIVAQGMIAYRNSQAVQAAKDAAQQAARVAAHATRLGDLGAAQEAVGEYQEAMAVAPKAVQTESGKLTYRKTWRWEIEEVEKIPAAYWMVDEKKIAAAVKAGIAIAGIKAWQEETPVIGS